MSHLTANKRVVAVINSVLSGEQPVRALDDVIAGDFKDQATFPGQQPRRDGFKDGVEKLGPPFDQGVLSLHTVAEGDLVEALACGESRTAVPKKPGDSST